MLHFINEGNQELKNRRFPLGKGIKKHLLSTLQNYNGDRTVDGYKRLNNLLSTEGGVSYSEMKRIKNFFDNFQGTDKSVEFILNGGEPMKMWVNNTLNTATKAIHDFKQAKKDAGVKNAFIKSHEKNRQNKKKNKPTQVKFKTDNLSQNIKNNDMLRFENRTRTYNIFYITEGQFHIIKEHLNEAQDEEFSLETLSNLKSFKARYDYCCQHIGKPQGRGSSRVVFQLSDERILKLAYNQKGVAQNEAEYDGYLDQLGVVPHTFESDDNGLWLISEYVLPAKAQDFKKCFGMSFKDFCDFMGTSYKNRATGRIYFPTKMSQEQYVELIENNEELSAFDEYIANYAPPFGDLVRLCNYGMTIRDGKPTIVLLDSGLTQEIWDTYYKRW